MFVQITKMMKMMKMMKVKKMIMMIKNKMKMIMKLGFRDQFFFLILI